MVLANPIYVGRGNANKDQTCSGPPLLLQTGSFCIMAWVGQNHTFIGIRCTHGVFRRGITIQTVIYGADIRFWPTLIMASYLYVNWFVGYELPGSLVTNCLSITACASCCSQGSCIAGAALT
jgi:hypothetical protein